MTGRQELQQALQALAANYAADLPTRIAELDARVRALAEGRADAAECALLHRQLHSLHGSAKTFGFAAVSDSAREIEHLVGGLNGTSLEASVRDRLLAQLEHLLAAAQVPGSIAPAGTGPAPSTATLAREIWLLEPDARSAGILVRQLQTFGYAVRELNAPEQVSDALAREAPTALIADLAVFLSGGIDTGPDVPLLFTSAADTLDARLEAARAGGRAFFVKPLRVGQLVDRLDGLLRRAGTEPYRVLLVDDATDQADYYAAILRDTGMRCAVVSDPHQLMEALQDFNPELVLMDIYLPHCRGDELARVIRQNDAFLSLPIVFLSVEKDFERQIEAMSLGGDDFLTKPIAPAHLRRMVASRVERYRELRVLMLHDSLTGLVNHSRLQQQLDIEFARAMRQGQPMSLAMIDIDHFKRVNDAYGHQVGDRVLKNLARFLRQRLRSSDVVGRYGGEEFAVVLSGTPGNMAEEVVNALRRDFAAVPHETGAEPITVTFSAGISSLPGHASARELGQAADQALYRAKNAGRNRVMRDVKADAG
jgi:diguanylate cyclase (GGDEF)-like protein